MNDVGTDRRSHGRIHSERRGLSPRESRSPEHSEGNLKLVAQDGDVEGEAVPLAAYVHIR